MIKHSLVHEIRDTLVSILEQNMLCNKSYVKKDKYIE